MRPSTMPALHSEILPRLRREAEEQGELEQFPPNEEDYSSWVGTAEEAVIFDCRPLPIEFVRESGVVAFEEHEATKTPFHLPYNHCYFEFEKYAVDPGHPEIKIAILAVELGVSRTSEEITDEIVEHLSLDGLPPDSEILGSNVEVFAFIHRDNQWFPVSTGGQPVFYNWTEFGLSEGIEIDPDKRFFDISRTVDAPTDVLLRTCAYVLVGAVSLLSDKLLASEHLPDPAPKLTKARAKRGRPRLTSDYYVLKVNVAAIRDAASKNPVGTHESPKLHWRRGHWRVLHRGSEFESKIRVKHCLVGDPAKGYAAKGYRLVRESRLIVEG